MSTAKQLEVYSDGGCIGNPGPGAWAYIITGLNSRFEGSGADPSTTNNRMELTAIIKALTAIMADTSLKDSPVEVFTDSRYVEQGINHWLERWVSNSWRTSTKAPVKNQDLWHELHILVNQRHVSVHWISGHTGNPLNEQCHTIVHQRISEQRGSKA